MTVLSKFKVFRCWLTNIDISFCPFFFFYMMRFPFLPVPFCWTRVWLSGESWLHMYNLQRVNGAKC